ncbi:transcription elongation factor GreB [Thalassotalea sp. PS06]|uniref:transcription elongation factor GreB n=1 Tax=Thalassotalea sp. PS06 TaxID=2594005 RepID=UPI00116404DA|nr:transcription elongation factor GreB [Thalassotalea sp. PS06]QDP00011.1 transcription elongation factor GreB [Thalassotalea sp. PS06]
MKRSNYITRQGWQVLDDELKFLWKQERPKVTQAVSEAAALGDRSENAEYIYGKKRLREIDRRVRFLMKRLDELTIVYPQRQQAGKIFFGAKVGLIDEDDQQVNYQLVGPDEFNVSEGKISIDSPIARALLSKQVGDEVMVKTPQGERYLEVISIDYDFSTF